MKILVTGGAGFIGSHLCERLLKLGHTVVCLDNFLTGTRANVVHLLSNQKFSLQEGDVATFNDEACDAIVHLACPAAPRAYQKNPIATLRVSFEGTRNLLELARKNQARLVFTSSSEVYGDPLVHPQGEDYWGNVNPNGPRACYDEGKRVAEALCLAYAREHKIDVRLARVFNTYGPGMQADDGRAVPNFITQALQNKPMTVYGDGSQTRSLCYIDDLIEGIITMLRQEGIGFNPINLGNPDELTMLALAQEIKSLTDSSSEIIFQPLPQDDPHHRCPDITRAKNILNWSPGITRQEGLQLTIEWFILHKPTG